MARGTAEVWVLLYQDVDPAARGHRVTWPLLFSRHRAAIEWLAEHDFWPITWTTSIDDVAEGRDPSGRLWRLYAEVPDRADFWDACEVRDDDADAVAALLRVAS